MTTLTETGSGHEPIEDAGIVFAPARTPRPPFQITRRLVGASRWPLVLLTIVYSLNYADQYLVPAMFPVLKREFGLSDTALGVLSGSYLIVVTIGTVPFGVLADTRRRTRVIAWGTTVWGAAMIATGLARSYPALLASRMVLGSCDPCDNPTSQSLLADYYPVNQRSKVMSVYQVGQLFGVFILPVAVAMATEWGWRSAFFFLSLPAFVVSLLVRRLGEPVRGNQDRRHQHLRAEVAVPSGYDGLSTGAAYRAILRVPTFVATVVASAVGTLGFGAIGTWAPTFLVRYHDMSLSDAASALILLALGGLLGALLSGYVADYLAFRGHLAARVLVAGVCRFASFPLFFVTFSVGSTPVMLVVFTISALTLIAPIAVINAARADVLHPSLRGRGTALDASVQGITAALAPAIVGVLADAFTLRAALLMVIPLVGVAGIILLIVALPAYVRDERRLREIVRAEAEAAPRPDDDPNRPATGTATPTEATGTGARREEELGERRDDVVLEIEALDVSYGSVQVLFGADLLVPRQGCSVLVGRNGVGKTTLLNAIAGLVDPSGGRLMFNGIDLLGVPPEQRVRLGVTLMAGGRSTFPNLTVRENLWLGAYPYKAHDDLTQARLAALLEIFPQLASRLDQLGGTLSGGEQQMVALGRALMAGPEFLLIDELSLGLAPTVTDELLDVVEQVASAGTAVLLVEQTVTVALEVADQVFFMEKGAIEDLGPAAGVSGDELVRWMMTGSRP